MGELLSVASEGFWLGVVGAFIATGYLTQIIKLILETKMKKTIGEKWKPMIALPAGFLVALLYQTAMVSRHNALLPPEGEPIGFMWGMVGAMTIINAAASAWAYRFMIKKDD